MRSFGKHQINPLKQSLLGIAAGVVCVLFLSASTLVAQEPILIEFKPAEASTDETAETNDPAEILAGHSYHGEVFNEGPRQKAYLMGGTGHVSFPISTKNARAQQFFEQGIGQLYGFWYYEAERSFRQAASLDPDCAIAYWGAAMANLRNAKRSQGFIEEAVKRKGNTDEREVMYIDAVEAYIEAGKKNSDKRNDAYTKAMENIILKYPDDLEAKAFLTLHLYQSRKSSTSYLAVNALLQEIFDVEPMHSALHFRIHLWDKREPEEAVAAAAMCGQSSPSIAHMWHMPGHIFSRLKRYNDAAWQQEASARVDHAHMMRDRVMPDQIGNFAHNNEWFIRNLIHVGRVHDAADLAKNMTELPRHPRYNKFAKRGSAWFGRLRLFQVLRTYELWNEIIALAKTPYLEPTDIEEEQIKRLRYLGLAYFQVGDMSNGNAQIAELQRRQLAELQRHLDSSEADADDSEEPDEDEDEVPTEKEDERQTVKADEGNATPDDTDGNQAEDSIAKARKQFWAKVKNLEAAVNALKGHRAVANGEFQSGYDFLMKASDVDPLTLAKIQWLSGAKEEAEKLIRKRIKSNENQVHPLAIFADILWQSGKKEEAGQVFETLRTLSASIDLDSPVFARVLPIAEALGHPADWRVAPSLATDIGERPQLDCLGPFRWRPSPSPDWVLQDADGKTRSSAEFKGQPHIIIFYLGYGCLHCMEQLHLFAPKLKDFEEAGLTMIAISTDSQEDLKTSLDNFNAVMPIPLVSNGKLDVFKAFRVFDDFEKQPLHGTFIIDAEGMVRWQDISYEPFLDPEFVLNEAKRLLAQTPEPKERVARVVNPALEDVRAKNNPLRAEGEERKAR